VHQFDADIQKQLAAEHANGDDALQFDAAMLASPSGDGDADRADKTSVRGSAVLVAESLSHLQKSPSEGCSPVTTIQGWSEADTERIHCRKL